jgi:hypothetical protein
MYHTAWVARLERKREKSARAVKQRNSKSRRAAAARIRQLVVRAATPTEATPTEATPTEAAPFASHIPRDWYDNTHDLDEYTLVAHGFTFTMDNDTVRALCAREATCIVSIANTRDTNRCRYVVGTLMSAHHRVASKTYVNVRFQDNGEVRQHIVELVPSNFLVYSG